MNVRALDLHHVDALEELLLADVEVNLFLLGMLETWPRVVANWYGIFSAAGRLTSTALVFPGRLVVPWAPEPSEARALGWHMAKHHPPCMIVGPRGASDELWSAWASSLPTRCWFDQRLYVCRQVAGRPSVPGFRKARMSEWQVLASNAGKMEAEDLGRDPYRAEPSAFERAVKARIERGDTWVIERDGQLVFQINVGSQTVWGTQVGGTYVPPKYRGNGYAVEGTAALCCQLFRAGCRMITLHVNEANIPAVRTYERVGFERGAAFRLITLP